MARRTTGVKKKKQKTWYSIVSPKQFGEKEIAKTLALDSKNIIGRKVSLPLSDITGDFKHFHTMITLKINEVKDLKAYTEYNGQNLISDKIARMVNRWKSRIDAVSDISTKDDHKLRIKVIVITRRRVNTTIKSEIRKAVFAETEKYCKGHDMETIVSDIFSNKLQKALFHGAKNIYPLQSVEIRKTEVLK
ncbi:MAG: 30S ribosomal protein S3ae [Nanohaloarchaea archaeon]|nr:30S ribosomal protein S3ae [Candidatus Nanohaloarchaea archaeon]